MCDFQYLKNTSMHIKNTSTTHAQDCRLFYAFSSVLDAVRFAHVSQMYLMADTWDACDVDCEAFGPTQQTPDGRLLFRGPRMAMVITWTAEYECVGIVCVLCGMFVAWQL